MGQAGTAYVNVVPKFPGFSEAIRKEVEAINGESAGKKYGAGFSGGAAGGIVKTGAAVGVFSQLTQKAMETVAGSVGDAVARFDTLNAFPSVMQALGYSSEDAQDSIDKMSDRLQTLPTRLDDMTSTVQGLAAVTGDLDLATDAGLALNDMLVASGANTQLVNSATEQFRQMLSKGKPELEDWKSLTSAMPGQMDQLAKAMLGPTAGASDLYTALGGGGADPTVSMEELLQCMVRLDEEGGQGITSFKEQAETASGGVATAAANAQNAVVKGVAGIMDEIGAENIAGVFGDIKTAVNEAFGAITPIVGDAMPAVESIYGRVKDLVPELGNLAISAGLAKVGFGGFSKAADGVKSLSGRLKEAKEQSGGLAKINTALGTSLTPVSIGAGIAATAIATIATAAIESKKRMDDFEGATSGLSDALHKAADASGFESSVKSVGESAADTAQSLGELLDSQARWADAIAERGEGVAAANAQLDGYASAIDDLAGRSDLSADEVAELQLAVDGLNESCGTSYTVAQDAGGAYQVMSDGAAVAKDSILKLVDAQKAQSRLDAASDGYTEALQKENDAARTLAEAQQNLSDYQSEYFPLVEKGTMTLQEYETGLRAAETNVRVAGEAHDAAAGALSSFDEQMTLNKMAAEGLDAGYANLIASSPELMRAIEDSGWSLTGFRDAVENAGVSVETLESIGAENFSALAEACNGNMDMMVWAIQHYNDTPLLDKDGNVQVDDAELIDAQGNVYLWDGTGLWDKNAGAYVDSAQVVDGAGNILNYDATSLDSKWSSAKVDGNAVDGSAQSGIQNTTAASESLDSKDVSVNVGGNYASAAPSIWDLGRALGTIVSKTANVVANVFAPHAEGGIRLHAAGGIRARGGVATSAVPLDIVGEDGAEAIVPLTNKRYSQPFIDLLAEGIQEHEDQQPDYDMRRIERLLSKILDAMPDGMSEREFGRKVRRAANYA